MKLKVDELEELAGESGRNKGVIEKILEELTFRKTRTAKRLEERLHAIYEGGQQDLVGGSPIDRPSYLPLENQTGVLPPRRVRLRVSDDVISDFSVSSMAGDRGTYLLVHSVLSGLTVGPVDLLADMLDQFSYIGPLRNLPPRVLVPQRTPDASRWAKGMAAWELLHDADAEFIERLNYWMGPGALNTGYHVELKRYREVPVNVDFDHRSPQSTEADIDEADADAEDYSSFVAEFREYADQVLADKPSPMYRPQVLQTLSSFLGERLGEADPDVKGAAATYVSSDTNPLEEFPVKSIIRLRETRSGLEVSPQDIGVGISQLLPVLILALHQQTGIISVEQPELHVHPAIQVELADLFVSALSEKGKLFLLETHSEHLVLRLLRRIRETTDKELPENRGEVRPEQISIVYVEPSENTVRFNAIGIDADGEFTNRWPHGFFGERLDEL